MNVSSTRDESIQMPALKAVLEGIAPDGGLFVPVRFPAIDARTLLEDAAAGYPRVAARVLADFFDIDRSALVQLATDAYAGFDAPEVVPLKKFRDGLHVLELFHGPTLAFKDMALQILPRLMDLALGQYERKEDALILTATSGDTGKAALEGFRDVARASVFVFYPDDGVAEMQRLQMVTQRGGNVGACAVRGNFDDAQTGLKRLFTDAAFNAEIERDGYFLSAANSINIGRLLPQIAYYCHAYARLIAEGGAAYGEKVNFVVPTGNFGNILSAHYAREMGLPVGKLICASNSNNVLTDFFRQGRYDVRREFHKTISPSMDILVSSNLERLLYEMCGRDCATVREWMAALGSNGHYEIPASAREWLSEGFYADCCSDAETEEAIRRAFGEYGYVLDPHTAVAMAVYGKYCRGTGDATPTVVTATANPYKFAPDVLRALGRGDEANAFAAAERLKEATGTPIPGAILELRRLPELHTGVVDKDGMADAVRAFLRGVGRA